MKRFFKWTGGILLGLSVLGFTGLSFLAGSPKDALYMVRYGLPHMHRSHLRVGYEAPDARLVALDGSSTFHIRERAAGKPLVLIFGSYT